MLDNDCGAQVCMILLVVHNSKAADMIASSGSECCMTSDCMCIASFCKIAHHLMPPKRCIALQTFGDVLQGNGALNYMQFAQALW